MVVDVESIDPVVISYHELKNAPGTLSDAITKGFGSDPECLGIVVVKDLPQEYPALRERLLRLAKAFAGLPEATREKYADPSSSYSFGWSHGKEIMNGRPDTLKGSYYANINPATEQPPITDELRQKFKEYYRDNLWPASDEKGVEGFEEAFKGLGDFVFGVGCLLADACQSFASPHLGEGSPSLASLIRDSRTTKARLLHYFPPVDDAPAPKADDPLDWCGTHLDHSLLTGLCSALYLDPENTVVPSPSPSTGLYIATRGGKTLKVSIPPDALAFQTGEALELATGGRLRATPHYVRVDPNGMDERAKGVSRSTFALFMQPEVDAVLGPSETFGSFSKKVFGEHYESTM